MKAVKGNKEYTIGETQQKFYQDSGFDIFDDAGVVTAYGRGKTVPYDDHMNAVKEIKRLQEIVTELNTENEALKTRIEDLEKAAPKPAEKNEKASAKKAGE